MELLGKIDSPEDLRKLEPSQMKQVSEELRDYIIEVISKQGGHFASNLGSVELTVALHYVFDTPNDKIVWDVGHQSYGHKILTGRRDNFHTIRKFKGLAGFTTRSESKYDHFGAGHASTSVSAAVGMAQGLKSAGLDNMAIAVVGDGSFTGGLVYEAMNHAGHIPAKNLIVVLNDNDMSIDPNVGALQTFINKTTLNKGYNRFRHDIKNLLTTLKEDHGLPLADLVGKIRSGVKNFVTPAMLFECFGFRYFGPVNGHDVDEVVNALQLIKEEGPNEGPYLLHALTTKGRGYKLAEEAPIKYHGVSPFQKTKGIVPSTKKKVPNYANVFADTLIKLAETDERIVAITPAMPSGSGLTKFQDRFPDRFFDVGIAEAHSILYTAGMATEGYRAVAAIYSTFLQRAYDQVIHDVGIQNLPVVFALDRAGCVGADGATHQGQYDNTYLRSVPNFVVMAPKDENELQHMIKTSIDYEAGPISFRYPRGPVVGVPLDEELKTLEIGKGELLHADHTEVEVLLIGSGFAVQSALAAQKILSDQGIKTAVINSRFIKPLDEELILHWMKNSTLTVTVEENAIMGGFGSAVLEMMARNNALHHVLNLGIPDQILEHGTQTEQRQFLQIDGPGIAAQTLRKLETLGRSTSSAPLIPGQKATDQRPELTI